MVKLGSVSCRLRSSTKKSIYVKAEIRKQVTGGTEKAYTEGIERLTVNFAKRGPWTEMDPQASKLISNVGEWLVSYAIMRRKANSGIVEQALHTLVDS